MPAMTMPTLRLQVAGKQPVPRLTAAARQAQPHPRRHESSSKGHAVVCQASDDWESPVFGVPMAPKEYWERFQKNGRCATPTCSASFLPTCLHVTAAPATAASI